MLVVNPSGPGRINISTTVAIPQENCKKILYVILQVIIFHVSAPASFPPNVMAVVRSSTTILVTWCIIPLVDRNGDITVYQVLYQPLQIFHGAITQQTVNVTGLAANLTDLEEFVNYNIAVRAYTSVGGGPYSEPITERTDEDGNGR